MIVLATEVVHDGFFMPREPEEALATEQFHYEVVEDLPCSVMFCRVRVIRPDGLAMEHVVVYSHYPPLDDDTVAELARVLGGRYPKAILSFTRDNERGRSRVVCCTPRANRVHVAAAIATNLAVAAWDESDPIVVELGEEEIAVSLNHDGRQWQARIDV